MENTQRRKLNPIARGVGSLISGLLQIIQVGLLMGATVFVVTMMTLFPWPGSLALSIVGLLLIFSVMAIVATSVMYYRNQLTIPLREPYIEVLALTPLPTFKALFVRNVKVLAWFFPLLVGLYAAFAISAVLELMVAAINGPTAEGEGGLGSLTFFAALIAGIGVQEFVQHMVDYRTARVTIPNLRQLRIRAVKTAALCGLAIIALPHVAPWVVRQLAGADAVGQTAQALNIAGALLFVLVWWAARSIRTSFDPENRFTAALWQADYNTAIAAAHQIVNTQFNPEIVFSLGNIYMMAGKMNKGGALLRVGILDLKARIKEDPKQKGPHETSMAMHMTGLAAGLMGHSRFEEATGLLQKAAELIPTTPWVQLNIAEVWLEQGKPIDEIIAQLDLADRLRQDARHVATGSRSTFYALRAWAVALKGEAQTADKLIHQAFKVAERKQIPLMSPLWYFVGCTHLALNRLEQAGEAFSQVIAIDPRGLYNRLARAKLELCVTPTSAPTPTVNPATETNTPLNGITPEAAPAV